MSKIVYVEYPQPGPAKPDKKNCLFNPSGQKEKGVCVIPAKAVRTEGSDYEKNNKHTTEFES